MTRQETQMIIMQLTASYAKGLLPEISKEMIDSWHVALMDIEYDDAVAALTALISVEKYPPTIAAIRQKIAQSRVGDMTAADAFAKIREAVRKFGYYQPDLAMNYLGDLWQHVSRMTWDYFCLLEHDQIHTAFAQFRAMYEHEAELKMNRLQVPAHVQARLDAMRIKAIEGELK